MPTKKEKKYRSKLEESIHKQLGAAYKYETTKLEYEVWRNYTVDFTYKNTYIELKGYFRTGDTQKYHWINLACKNLDITFVMLLQNPNKPIRKGTKLTMGKWCDKHDIPWFSVQDISSLKRYCENANT